jgi:urease accessory protein
MKLRPFHSIASAALFLFAASPASAHHVMGGKLPGTFAEGMLSGLGHPVIGADHLAFLIAVGVIVAVCGLSLVLPVAFIVTMAIGVAAHVNGISIPASEFVVALTVLTAGLLLVRERKPSTPVWAALFAVAGFFHGYAFGESIFGAERAPLGAYLVGLVIIQSALILGVAFLTRRIQLSGVTHRLIGAAVGGVGIAIVMAQIVPAG